MMQNQNKYVPSIKIPNESEVHVDTIFCDGDELTLKDGDIKGAALRAWTHWIQTGTQKVSCMK